MKRGGRKPSMTLSPSTPPCSANRNICEMLTTTKQAQTARPTSATTNAAGDVHCHHRRRHDETTSKTLPRLVCCAKQRRRQRIQTTTAATTNDNTNRRQWSTIPFEATVLWVDRQHDTDTTPCERVLSYNDVYVTEMYACCNYLSLQMALCRSTPYTAV